MRALVVAAVLAASASVAAADPPEGPVDAVDAPAAPAARAQRSTAMTHIQSRLPRAARRGPTAVIATQPLALIGRGVSLSYERLVWPRVSASGLLGVRGGAGGDYSSRTWTLGAAARYWFRASAAKPMRGLHLGLHVSAGHTSLTDDVMDTHVGSAWALSQRLEVGYRFVAWRRLTLTPALGLALREDVDRTGHLATTARPALTLGFELGWML